MSGDVEWRPAQGYEGRYEVSTAGEVRSCSTYHRRDAGRHIRGWIQNRGYRYVTLMAADGSKRSHGVHRLVLETFVGPCPPGHQAAHSNGDSADNRLANLRWASAKENIADRTRHGRTRSGEQNGSSKLDRHAVKTIKRMGERGFSAYETARLACVAPSTVESIWRGETWKHVS